MLFLTLWPLHADLYTIIIINEINILSEGRCTQEARSLMCDPKGINWEAVGAQVCRASERQQKNLIWVLPALRLVVTQGNEWANDVGWRHRK